MKILMKPSYGAATLTFEANKLVFTGTKEFAKDFIEEQSKYIPLSEVMEMLNAHEISKKNKSFTGNTIEINMYITDFDFKLRSYGIEVSFDSYGRESILKECLSSMPLVEVWHCLPLRTSRNILMVILGALNDPRLCMYEKEPKWVSDEPTEKELKELLVKYFATKSCSEVLYSEDDCPF